ncbi:hypothetical protein K3888_16145 [Dietzia aurantiaca]|uniref:hypothetical protein n=1 Tax=Dietzia aurantiaca TaxID=983873 RepID=UPI001E5A644B|nr:hypothetical protein [Dietzia aurantiaca]MCD2264227.1 hypothetical protein [Dietzia aurantiaca]
MAIKDWLPLFAAIITGAVALIGVWWSIHSARNRELRNWRREQLLKSTVKLLSRSVEEQMQMTLWLTEAVHTVETAKAAGSIPDIIKPPDEVIGHLTSTIGAVEELRLHASQEVVDHSISFKSTSAERFKAVAYYLQEMAEFHSRSTQTDEDGNLVHITKDEYATGMTQIESRLGDIMELEKEARDKSTEMYKVARTEILKQNRGWKLRPSASSNRTEAQPEPASPPAELSPEPQA